ncbi:hypothetical protein [Asanoa hainanensis]|uniref:hypothetical protein n=1 Tax=Asanoa hainanensis TaxID=560556 RepID=UPI001FEA9AEB|nr:hypothetical protein [Asanoa hainanensis]
MACAQGNAILALEVQVDDDPRQAAVVRPEPNLDTRVQWIYPWQATLGTHTLRVRAVDRTAPADVRVALMHDGSEFVGVYRAGVALQRDTATPCRGGP